MEMCLQYMMITASRRNAERVKTQVKKKTAAQELRREMFERRRQNGNIRR